MLTIKEVANIARRMSNAVDSTTATIATESSKLRDDFARTTDLLEMSEFVSEESMTKCIGMLEDRIKHALRIFTDILKTSGGRNAAQAFHAQLRRDASLSPGLGSTGASRKSIVAGTLFGATNDSVAATASPIPTIDVDRMLMESGMVCVLVVNHVAALVHVGVYARGPHCLKPTALLVPRKCQTFPSLHFWMGRRKLFQMSGILALLPGPLLQ
jgi:hypothetical protein